jgi:hypothetical protein
MVGTSANAGETASGFRAGELGDVAKLSENQPSSILRQNLGHPPEPGMHAHHVIPVNEGGPGMNWLREEMVHSGVTDINAAENGVYLHGSNRVANPIGTVPHTTYLHAGVRKDYLFTISKRLWGKTGPEFMRELSAIKSELGSGSFLFQQAPSRWKPGQPIKL